MRLFFNKNTRSTRPRWLIEELGVPCEIVPVDLQRGEHKSPAHLRVHPLGKVPALEDDDGTVLIESAAICLHLADKFADRGLAPAPGTPTRGRYFQWMVYAVATLEGPVAEVGAEARKPEAERNPTTLAEARARFAAVAAPLEATLVDGPWLLGESFSAADVVVGSICAWARSLGLLEGFPALAAYTARCVARPAFSRART